MTPPLAALYSGAHHGSTVRAGAIAGRPTAPAVATLVPPNAPAIKFDTAAGQVNQPVVISERGIAGNSFQASAGFGDLIDAVQRAGAVKLVVV